MLVSFINVYAQSYNENFIKTTEYLETVLVEDNFISSFGNWQENGSVNYSLQNGKLKANVSKFDSNKKY